MPKQHKALLGWGDTAPIHSQAKGVRQSDVLLGELLRWMERPEAVPTPLPLPEVTLSSGCQHGHLHSCSLWMHSSILILSVWPMVEKKLLLPINQDLFAQTVWKRELLHQQFHWQVRVGGRGMRSERDPSLHLWEKPGVTMSSGGVTTPVLPAGTDCRAQHSSPHTRFSVAGWTLTK